MTFRGGDSAAFPVFNLGISVKQFKIRVVMTYQVLGRGWLPGIPPYTQGPNMKNVVLVVFKQVLQP